MNPTNPLPNILDKYPQLRPLESKEQFQELLRLAQKDNHSVINPTDVIWRDGKMIGFLSIGALPTVWAWLSTKDFSPRESVGMINTFESVVRRDSPGIYVPVPKHSPFHDIMPDLGYTSGGEYNFFFKSFLTERR